MAEWINNEFGKVRYDWFPAKMAVLCLAANEREAALGLTETQFTIADETQKTRPIEADFLGMTLFGGAVKTVFDEIHAAFDALESWIRIVWYNSAFSIIQTKTMMIGNGGEWSPVDANSHDTWWPTFNGWNFMTDCKVAPTFSYSLEEQLQEYSWPESMEAPCENAWDMMKTQAKENFEWSGVFMTLFPVENYDVPCIGYPTGCMAACFTHVQLEYNTSEYSGSAANGEFYVRTVATAALDTTVDADVTNDGNTTNYEITGEEEVVQSAQNITISVASNVQVDFDLGSYPADVPFSSKDGNSVIVSLFPYNCYCVVQGDWYPPSSSHAMWGPAAGAEIDGWIDGKEDYFHGMMFELQMDSEITTRTGGSA